MGLDQYAKVTRHAPDSPVDFEQPGDAQTIAYWRKHPNLQGWMAKLYWDRGGKGEEFYGGSAFVGPVALLPEDIDHLEADVLADRLPFTEGFFFGHSDPEDKADDLKFISKARESQKDGLCVYYNSSW